MPRSPPSCRPRSNPPASATRRSNNRAAFGRPFVFGRFPEAIARSFEGAIGRLPRAISTLPAMPVNDVAYLGRVVEAAALWDQAVRRTAIPFGNDARPIPQSREADSQGEDDDVQIQRDVPGDRCPVCGEWSHGR